MDPLSDVLALARVESSLFSRAELRGDWAVSTAGGFGAVFHVLLDGEATLEAADGTTVALGRGAFVVLPHGHGHVLRQGAAGRVVPIRDLPATAGPDGLPVVSCGTTGPRTHVVCGTFRFTGPGRDLLLPTLPPVLHFHGGEPHRAWVEASLALLVAEHGEGRPGAAHLSARLGELLLVQAVRAHAAHARGWLGASADPQLGRALAQVHRHPEHDWSVDRLARLAALSRTAFYDRWTAVVGEPPAAYVLRLRMVRARDHLRGSASVGEVAAAVGYGSEAAFSRAFKRHVGASPAAWRRAAIPGPWKPSSRAGAARDMVDRPRGGET